MQANVQLVDVAETAAAMMHPVRSQLLEQFRDARSTAEVARALESPRQRIGHHVRVLRERGLLQVAGERRNGNFVEQLLQTTARVYVIAPQALGDLGTEAAAIQDRFSSEYLVTAAARTIRDLVALRQRAEESDKKLATMTLETEVRFAGPRQQAAFADELAAALVHLSAKYHDTDAPAGRRFRFSVGGYPALSADPGSPEADPGSPENEDHHE